MCSHESSDLCNVEPAGTSRFTVLVVDDTPKNLQVVGNLLKKHYQVDVATHSKQALEKISKRPPDLILLDIMMPEMDGYEVCRCLRDNTQTQDIPIIFLTAKTEIEDLVKGFALGAVDYVTKPFITEELLARVKTHLELRQSRQEISRLLSDRNQLIHVLCHDMATPINIIKCASDMFLKDMLETDQYAEMVQCANEQCQQIVELIRSMMALEDKGLLLTAIDLNDAVRESVSMLQSQLQSKGIAFSQQLGEDLWITAERTSLIHSVINNLLTNAVKFTDEGGQIELRTYTTDQGIAFSCRDNGIGMPRRILDSLFDVNGKTHRPGTAGEQGTGFGMPLVKRFVEAYGGWMSVSSQERSETASQSGTTICIEFVKAPVSESVLL